FHAVDQSSSSTCLMVILFSPISISNDFKAFTFSDRWCTFSSKASSFGKYAFIKTPSCGYLLGSSSYISPNNEPLFLESSKGSSITIPPEPDSCKILEMGSIASCVVWIHSSDHCTKTTHFYRFRWTNHL